LACEAVIETYEGHLARYRGDGILVYFVYPLAHEDDAKRGVRAAIDIIRDVARLQPRAGLELKVRIGIATGPVVVDETIGSGSAQEQVAMDDTPNLAARLQSGGAAQRYCH
jgi:class 3 adenylate cyclase